MVEGFELRLHTLCSELAYQGVTLLNKASAHMGMGEIEIVDSSIVLPPLVTKVNSVKVLRLLTCVEALQVAEDANAMFIQDSKFIRAMHWYDMV